MTTVVRYSSFGSIIATAAMMVACGGGNGGSANSGMSPSAQLPAVAKAGTSQANAPQTMSALDKSKHKNKGEIKFVVKIPPYNLKLTPISLGKQLTPLPFGKSANGKRNPKYVSPSTQSMTVAVSGQPTQIFNLTPSSSDCTTGSDGYLTCSESGFFPSGEQTIVITMDDGTNGTGNAFSTATTTADIVAGSITYISITLDGVVASATVLIDGGLTASIPEGTATSLPVTVNAYDADDNLIMAPGQYDASTPVTLSDSDTSGVTSLSSTSVSGPGSSLTLSYNGGTLSSATITAKVSGVASGSATLTVGPAPTPVVSPASLSFSSAATQTFSVQESNYTGTLTASSSNTSVATVSPASASGPSATFTVTPIGGGTCTITVTDSLGNTATVSVSVNGGIIIIDGVPVADPTSLTFDTSASQTFTVREQFYDGAFTESDTCSGIASTSPGSADGPSATFTVTPVNGGSCTIGVADASSNTASVSVSVSGGGIIIDSKHTHGEK